MKKSNKSFLCVISARGGSEGLKNKNLKNFNGKPLIAWSIEQAKKSNYVEDVYVSTDSKKIAEVAKKFGAKIPFIRQKKYSGKKISKFLVWKDALNKIERINKTNYDFYLDLDCTNPLRSTKDIDDICEKFEKINKNYDGIYTICASRKNPYFNQVEYDEKKKLCISKKLRYWPASRQVAPKVFDQVASMYLFKSNFIKKKNNMYQGKIYGHELKDFQNFDIDSSLDFFIIEKIFKKYYL